MDKRRAERLLKRQKNSTFQARSASNKRSQPAKTQTEKCQSPSSRKNSMRGSPRIIRRAAATDPPDRGRGVFGSVPVPLLVVMRMRPWVRSGPTRKGEFSGRTGRNWKCSAISGMNLSAATCASSISIRAGLIRSSNDCSTTRRSSGWKLRFDVKMGAPSSFPSQPMPDGRGGRFVRSRIFTQDITEARLAQEAIEKMNQRLEQRVEERTHQSKSVEPKPNWSVLG